MTVLCTDKTGTLTSAEITLARSLNSLGIEDPRAPGSARSRPTWAATAAHWTLHLWPEPAGAAQGWTLVGRHAFDFNRRLGSVLASGPKAHC